MAFGPCIMRIVSFPAGGDPTAIPEVFLEEQVCDSRDLDAQICWYEPSEDKLYFMFYDSESYTGITPSIVTAYLRDHYGNYLIDSLGWHLTSNSFEAIQFRYLTTNAGADRLIDGSGDYLFSIL